MDDLITKGRPQMARILSVSVNGLHRMELRGLPIHHKSKTEGHCYHLPTIWQWVKADQARQLLDAGGGDHKSLSLRRAKAETQRAEIEVAKLEASLIDLQMVRQGLEGLMINQRTIASSVPAQIGREIDDPELRVRVVAIVERQLHEMLEAMSRYDPVVESIRDDGGADDADDQALTSPASPVAKTTSQSVGRAKPVSESRRRSVRPVA